MLALFYLAGGLAACAERQETIAMGRSEAIEVARKYVTERMPHDSYVLQYDPVVVDLGTFWGVSFEQRGTKATGGTPEFYIDKQTMSVVKVQMAQ